MFKPSHPAVQPRRHFRTMSDDDAQRASQAMQQLAAGLDEQASSSPQPAVPASGRSEPMWRAPRHGSGSASPPSLTQVTPASSWREPRTRTA